MPAEVMLRSCGFTRAHLGAQGAVEAGGGQDADPLLTDNSLPPDSLSFLTLYPNPAQETLILTVRPSTGGTDLRADLLNIRGQTLASQPLLPERGYLRSQFDLRTLPPGAYLIKIKAGGRSDTRHFLKR